MIPQNAHKISLFYDVMANILKFQLKICQNKKQVHNYNAQFVLGLRECFGTGQSLTTNFSNPTTYKIQMQQELRLHVRLHNVFT